jgi:hypothetical protein
MASQFGTKLVGVDIFNQNFLFSRDRSTLTLFSRKLTRLRNFPLVHVVNGRIVFNKRKFDYKQVKYPSAKHVTPYLIIQNGGTIFDRKEQISSPSEIFLTTLSGIEE